MHDIKLIINEIPQAQGRPRFCRRGPYTNTYDPHKKIKDSFKSILRNQFGKEPIEEPIEIEIIFHMPIPKSTSKKKRASMLSNDIKHIKKPDCDNLSKLYLDCMNNLIFKDDSQIWLLKSKKLYSENPMVEIFINIC